MSLPSYRHEKKYIITAYQQCLLIERLRALMSLDPHVGDRTSYQIRSVYFDDIDNSCYFDNENGINRRKKYRIRFYDQDDSFVQLECKHKENYLTFKEAVKISREDAWKLMEGEYPIASSSSGLLTRFLTESSFRRLRPVIITDYVRSPFVYELGNVRITFDEKLSSSDQTEYFFQNDFQMRPVFPVGISLMEVKFDHFLPDYIHSVLQIGTLQETAFSKYYYCRKIHL